MCLGEVWLELNAATAPELTETFRAQTGGWGAGFCRRYAALGGQAALLAQLGADPFGRKLAAYRAPDAVLTGLETRTSSPVRLKREETLESAQLAGLYPCGEGAGYAGGIMSAAVDGLRVARAIIGRYAPAEG
mgnify:FL=1